MNKKVDESMAKLFQFKYFVKNDVFCRYVKRIESNESKIFLFVYILSPDCHAAFQQLWGGGGGGQVWGGGMDGKGEMKDNYFQNYYLAVATYLSQDFCKTIQLQKIKKWLVQGLLVTLQLPQAVFFHSENLTKPNVQSL